MGVFDFDWAARKADDFKEWGTQKAHELKELAVQKAEEAKNWTYTHAPEPLKQAINYVIPNNNTSGADSGSNTGNEAASPPPPRVLTEAERHAEWNGSYNNLIIEISNCPSVEARSALVKEHQEELIRFKDSNLPVDEHLKFLCVTIQGDILPNKNGQLLTGEAAWNYNYNDLIGKISMCTSMNERIELATKHQEELVKYRDSKLAVDNDLAYLDITLGTDGKVSTVQLDNVKNWLNDTKPISSPFKIEQGDDVISKEVAAVTGNGTAALSEIEKTKNVSAFTNERGVFQGLPNNGITSATKPLGLLKNTGNLLNGLTTGSDIGNTWTTDDGNTNLKRLEKTGIQVAGSVMSYGLGKVAAGAVVSGSLAAAPMTKGRSLLVGLPLAAKVDYEIAQGIDKDQKAIYRELGIQYLSPTPKLPFVDLDSSSAKELKEGSQSPDSNHKQASQLLFKFDCADYLNNYIKTSDNVEQSMGLKFGTNQQSQGVKR